MVNHNTKIKDMKTRVLITGGSLGAVAAALSCGRMGVPAVMVTPEAWIGGQLTSQGVPTDEHPWIDSTGSTASYREFRTRIRDYYRRSLPLDSRWAYEPRLNPGGGHVSPITHHPRIALQVLEDMLMPFVINGTLTILRGYSPVQAHVQNDRVRQVYFGDFSVSADYVIDATETGDLLPLTGTEYIVGAEGKQAHGEPHGSEKPDPMNQQAVSWCAVLGWDAKMEHGWAGEPGQPVPKPQSYEHWKTTVAPFWPGPQLSFHAVDPFTGKAVMSSLFGGTQPGCLSPGGYWAYRRIHRPDLFNPGENSLDATVLNWPQIDYWEQPLVDNPDPRSPEFQRQQAKELTLSFIHWLQTEAPREDGSSGKGYPEIFLREDVFGTTDGLAREVYYRESRRIKALRTVTELDIGVQARKQAYLDSPQALQAEQFNDTVGLASYRIDLHPSTGGDCYIDIESYPAQLPLSALIPVRMENLIPGCKNIGTTHLSSGMYRVHPSEWNIGEAAGALAAHSVLQNSDPRQIATNPHETREFQLLLHDKLGFELEWPPHVATIPRYVPQFQWILKEKRKAWRLT